MYPDSFNFSFYICGILATISFIMVNAVSNEMVNTGTKAIMMEQRLIIRIYSRDSGNADFQLHGGSAFTGGILGGSGIKVFLFTGFVLGFTSIIAAIWIMVAEFAVNEARTDKYPGYALLIHNVFIFLSTLIYKFGRQSENDYLASY